MTDSQSGYGCGGIGSSWIIILLIIVLIMPSLFLGGRVIPVPAPKPIPKPIPTPIPKPIPKPVTTPYPFPFFMNQ